MGTRCSGRSPRDTDFDATWGNDTGAAFAGSALTATGWGAAAAFTAPRTSPLVTRPSLPVPTTESAARLLSAINLAADGMATPAMETLAGTTVAGAATAARAVAPGAAATPALPSVSMRAINCSAATVAPSATTSSASTPAAGAGTSSTTLSVSISINISSMATKSPAFFFHCNRVASATDSDSWGTFTSTIAISNTPIFISMGRHCVRPLVRMNHD